MCVWDFSGGEIVYTLVSEYEFGLFVSQFCRLSILTRARIGGRKLCVPFLFYYS
jgi:hypothetical protein